MKIGRNEFDDEWFAQCRAESRQSYVAPYGDIGAACLLYQKKQIHKHSNTQIQSYTLCPAARQWQSERFLLMLCHNITSY